MQKEEIIRDLKSQSTWQLFFLGYITFGVYNAHYCARQSKVMNQRLESAEQIPVNLNTALFVFSYSSLALFIVQFLSDKSSVLENMSGAVDVLAGVSLCAWGFFARNRINRLLALSSDDPNWFSGLATIFITPLYFNYKVNVLNEAPSVPKGPFPIKWEDRNKMREVGRRAESQMVNQATLKARIASQEKGEPLNRFGLIVRDESTFRLEIRRDAENGPLELKDTFPDIETLAEYLAGNTVFRIGDFVAR